VINLLSARVVHRYDRIRYVFIIALIVFGEGIADQILALMDAEQIGDLRIGMTAQALTQTLASCPLDRGSDQLWEADGLYHQNWQNARCGISLDMVSEMRGQAKSVASISVSSPFGSKTLRGIGIGSREPEVEKAYHAEKNAEESLTRVQFVAGSIYGGLIFTFNEGRVSKIFLGAVAE
jgi:hypothetical protein